MSDVFERPKKKKLEIRPPEELEEDRKARRQSDRQRRSASLSVLGSASEIGDRLATPTLLGR